MRSRTNFIRNSWYYLNDISQRLQLQIFCPNVPRKLSDGSNFKENKTKGFISKLQIMEQYPKKTNSQSLQERFNSEQHIWVSIKL